MPHIYLLVSFLVTFNLVNTQSPSKLEFLLSQVLEPYENHLQSFKEQISEILDTFQNFIPFNLSPKEFEDGYFSDNKPFNFAKKQLNNRGNKQYSKTEEYSENEDSIIKEENKGRMLSFWNTWGLGTKQSTPDCQNSGYLVNVSVTSYQCDNSTVNKTTYLERSDENCTILIEEKSLCVCPFDYHGNKCQIPNVYRCQVEPLTYPPDKCTINETSQLLSNSQRAYSYSIAGSDAPCHYVERDTIIEMKYKLSCHYDQPDLAFEGIKAFYDSDYHYYEQPEVNFEKYKFEKDGVKLSNYRPIAMKLKFINWKKLRSPLVYETIIDERHVFENETFGFNVTINSTFLSHSYGGRFYYTLVPEGHGLTVNKISGVLDDATFVEPMKINRDKRVSRYFVLLVVLVIMVILTIGFIKGKDWRKITVKNALVDEGRQNQSETLFLMNVSSSYGNDSEELKCFGDEIRRRSVLMQ